MVCGPIDHLAPLEAIGFPRGNCLYRVYSEGHHNSKQVYFRAIQGLLNYFVYINPINRFSAKVVNPNMVLVERAFTSRAFACNICLLKGDQDLFKYVIDYHRDRALFASGTASSKGFCSSWLWKNYLNRWNSWCWCLERKAKGQIHLLNQHHGNSSYFSLVDIGLIMFPHVKPTHAIPCHLTRIGWRSIASFFHCWFHDVICAIYWE